MEKEKKTRSQAARIGRILLKSVLFLLLFVLFLFLLILTPPVQRFLTGKVETYLQNKLKTRVEIASISFGLSGNIELNDVYLEDRTKDTLLSGGTIKAHLNFAKLFSNEVEVKDIELQNITAKVKRVLPDTVFNFQFIVDAFATAPSTTDTTSAPMKLNISNATLENVNLHYNDVITGNDMFARIGNLSVTIDTLDMELQHFDIPSVIARNVRATIKQSKPLATPEAESTDLAEAMEPSPLKLSVGTVDLSKIVVKYENHVSAFYTDLDIGQLKTSERLMDLQNNKVWLEQLDLSRSKVVIRLGKKEAAKVVAEEIEKEVDAQKKAGWDFRIANAFLNNNNIKFDNDNNPRLVYGMDYSHLLADSLTLHVSNFVMNTDSIAGNITKGSFREKSGFELDELKGQVLYANNQSYLKDLYIKTPGTEIQRNVLLTYSSYEAFADDIGKTVMDIELVDSYVQVKDILTFAPQLRSNAAFKNPEATWYLDVVGNGTMDRLNIERLQFDGLSNTSIDARGTLTGLSNPDRAGGDFVINKLHTTQTDIALFTGQRLSNAQVNLPEAFDISGTVVGNAGVVNTNLTVSTSMGGIAVAGRFSNLSNPNNIAYNANVRTSGLKLGTIMRQPAQFGTVSGSFNVNGSGITPETMNTKFSGNLGTFGYNKYQYRNIRLNGSLRRSVFNINADIADPNADLNLVASGNLSNNPTIRINGMVDSIKTLPLHFTTEPFIFRGKIDGTVANIAADNPDADVLITKALLVSGTERLPLDTIQVVSGSNDAGNFLQLRSDIANAGIQGQYRLADLGNIIQSSIQPYFSVKSAAGTPAVKPYDFTFHADVVYAPILSAFVPGLTTMERLRAEGSFATGQGMNATVSSPYILYNGNEINNLNLQARTSDSGLNVSGTIARIRQGNSLDLYNTRINATALNNIIDFNVGVDDQGARNKYVLSGVVTQPSTGIYAIRLKPDSLLLNYERWTISDDNLLTIGPNSITANNFVLSKDGQQMAINSVTGAGNPLQVQFQDFRLATITGFIKSDSLLVDGLMNGTVNLKNVLTQPTFTSDLTINDLSMKQDTIGNVTLQVATGSNGRYNINSATITGRGNDISLTGSFAPVANDIDLDLDLDVRQLQLSTIEGALANVISNASGAINGKVRIQGTTASPDVKGDLNFDNASFALTVLGSQFRIDNEKIAVTENGFVFDNFIIRDSTNNQMAIDGTVLTSNFINYDLDLDVTATNFEVLNSTKAQNKLYYGKLNITADAHIAGTESQPVVDGSITVNDGTNLFVVVPQQEQGIVDREGIVQFVNMSAPENDSLFLTALDSLNRTDVLGMEITANIEIKKEAILNVIVDPSNGDFLNVRGEAVLSAGVDPSGKITLVGTYALEEGSYQISFNFIQRKFDIVPGSTIIWTGEPTTAQLNVTALYIANTAPLDLIGDQISAPTTAIRNTYLQKLPFEVRLTLTGELMQPIIDFDISLPQDRNYGVSNDIVTAVDAKLQQIRQDEGEINKQVFALLLLGRFVGENPFKSSGDGFSAGTYARQSVSKLLTEQLNNLAAGLLGGVDLNFDVTSSDDYTTGDRRARTDLNVGLSKKLLNDRLQVSVGSNFQLEGPQNSNQRSNNLASNIAVDYQLSKDGKYMLRFYRANEYQGVIDGYIIETGVSFILSLDYNVFRQLFNKRRQRVTSTGTVQNAGTQ